MLGREDNALISFSTDLFICGVSVTAVVFIKHFFGSYLSSPVISLMTKMYIVVVHTFLRIDKDYIFDHKVPCSW